MTKTSADEVVQAPLDADTETRILDAAHAVFMRRGTAGARMTEIAREAGVNHALVHYYFRSNSVSPRRCSAAPSGSSSRR